MKQESYMTDEELRNMSVEEIAGWLGDLAEEAAGFEEEEQRISLEDYYKAYESPEYKAFLENAGSVDTTPMIFDDSDDIEAFNRRYKEVKKLNESTAIGAVYDAYDKLYAAYYPYIKRVNPFWSAGAERLEGWAELQKEHPTVFTIDKKNAALFKELCTDEAYSMIGKDGYHALGALRMKGGRKLAAGIMIFSLLTPGDEEDEAAAVIRWLYVDENLRGCHVADDLMAELYHILNGVQVKMVACEIPMKGLLPITLAGFLSSWWIFFTADPQMDRLNAKEVKMYMAGANVSPEEDITEEMLEAMRPLYDEEHK